MKEGKIYLIGFACVFLVMLLAVLFILPIPNGDGTVVLFYLMG